MVALDEILFLLTLPTSVSGFVYSRRKRIKKTRHIFKAVNIV